MQRVRPLHLFLSRFLVVTMFTAQLPLATLARADDSDALEDPSIFESPAAVVKSPSVPMPKPRPAAAGPSASELAAKKKPWGVAQPLVDANPEFDKADKKQVSDIAICDVANEATKKKAGIAAQIDSWPPKDTSKWDAAAKKFAAEQRRLSLGNPAMSSKHNSFTGQIEGRVDLSGASSAREEFFQYTFGGKDKKPGWFVESICEGKRQIAGKVKTYEASLHKAASDTQGGCRAFETLRDMHGTILSIESKSLERLNSIMNGTDKELAGMKSFQGLEYIFEHDSAQDFALTKKAGDQAATAHVSAEEAKQLDAENEALWGKIKHDKGTVRFEKPGYFSTTLLQLRAEQKRTKQLVSELTKAHNDAAKKFENCKSENPYDYPSKAAKKPVAKPSDLSGVETAGKKRPDVSGSSQPHALPVVPVSQGPLDRDDRPAFNPTEQPPSPPASIPPPAAAPPEQPPPPQAAPRQPSAVGTFLKDNWMWLAGGAALAGGGVFLYKKYKDDKAKKAYWQDDSNFITPRAATVVTSPGTTGPAAGSKFMFISSVTGPGGIGQSMGPLSVAITDPSGVIQNVSGTAILSCASPSPCSIGGATTATITAGQATFSGVTFSSADQNVLLQVSGAGVANSTAPSTFNVGGSTATNPRY